MNTNISNTEKRHLPARKLGAAILVAGLCLGAFQFSNLKPTVQAQGRISYEACVALYERAVDSVAWVKTQRGFGTAWVVDAQKGLMVTALHVVANGQGGTFSTVDLLFPQKDSAGEVIHSVGFYAGNAANLAIQADVVHFDGRRDMAVLKLRRLPANLRALPLALRNPKVGQEVHVIGNSAVNHGGLFGYCNGHVRNVFHWTYGAINSHIVAHHVPTNKGDSGGPVLNHLGEVVAFISQGTTGGLSLADVHHMLSSQKQGKLPTHDAFDNVQILDHSIAVNEIRNVLEDCVKTGI